jgi:hypothetical protein
VSTSSDLEQALSDLDAKGDRPLRPVLHSRDGTLVTIAFLGPDLKPVWAGALIRGSEVRFVGPAPPPSGHAEFHQLSGPSARLVDLFAEAGRLYLERTEEVDEKVADLQRRGREVPLDEIWALQRRTGTIRMQIGRALVAVAECEGALAETFPETARALPTVRTELARVRDMAANVQQSVSDFVLLRQAGESNRLADTTNELSKTSNRIAALANISNIRMLGITYVALVLAIISAVILIPNTAATILGMPSAAWVNGWVVSGVLAVLAMIPIVVVFTRPWIRRMLREFRTFEAPTTEGLAGLREISPEAAAEERPGAGDRPAPAAGAERTGASVHGNPR